MRALIIVAAAFLALSCTTSDPEACERAATIQAATEERWGDLLERHIAIDQTLAADPNSASARSSHDDSAAQLVAARVEVIIASAETRRVCG